MSTFTDLKCWYDTGYTDGSSEIPPVGHALGTPDLTFAGPFVPSKDRLFNELQLPEEFTDLLNVSYIQLTLNLNNGLSTTTLFGWVDDVILHSDSTGKPMTTLKWHVDMWRTFNGSAEYGSGFVIRRPSTGADFYQNYPYRCKVTDTTGSFNIEEKDISPNGPRFDWWWILAVQNKDSDKVTSVQYYAAPVHNFDYVATIHIKDASDNVGTAPYFRDIFSARIDEMFEIDPNRITGAWLSPVPPMGTLKFSGIGTADEPLVPISGVVWESYTNDHSGTRKACFRTRLDVTGLTNPFYHSVVVSTSMSSIESYEAVVVDPFGATIGTIPFNKSTATLENTSVDLVVSSVSAYLRIALGEASEGMVFVYPLPTIEVNENSWSSYVYSGQREYDKAMRKQNSEKGMIEGGISGMGSGALIGAMVGAAGGPIGVGIGAIIGGVGSLIGGALELGVYNDKFQEAEDRYHASQADTSIFSGDASVLYYRTHGHIKLQRLKYDDDSLADINNIKIVQGVKYNVPLTDCTALIAAGGPMQISNLIVKGNIPTVAKKWIKQKFADGVRIVIR